jgi:hypothetical protein
MKGATGVVELPTLEVRLGTIGLSEPVGRPTAETTGRGFCLG